MRDAFFNVWFLVTCSDAIGATLAVFTLYRLRTRFSYLLAVIFATIAIEATVAAMSLLVFWPNEWDVAPTFALLRSGGRALKSVGVWVLVLYLLNFWQGLHHTIEGK